MADSDTDKVASQTFTLSWRQGNVEVSYTVCPDKSTHPLDVVALIDKLVIAVGNISGLTVSTVNDTTGYAIKCSTCGRMSTVSFKPNPKKPVQCNECYIADNPKQRR